MSSGRTQDAERRSWWHSSRSLLAFLTVAALVLAACGGDGGTDDDASEPAAGSEGGSEAAGGEDVTIVAWFNGETVPSDEFAPLEEQGITVQVDIRGDAILTDMLRMRDAGEKLPDLVEIDSNLTPAFLEADLLAPMTEEIATWEEEDPELYETIPPSVWEDGTYDGEIMHIPNKSLVDALYYNIKLIEDAGVDPPPYDSYDELLEAARGVQEAMPDLPAYFATGGTSPDRMYRFARGFGVPFEGSEENIPQFTTPEGVEMITWLQTMFEEKITDPEFVVGENDEAPGAFVAGRLPFMEEGINNGGAFMLDDFVHGEDWATAPTVINEGGTYNGVPRGFSMAKDTENPYEASLVMRYLMSPEIAEERYLELESGVVQSIPVLEGDALKEAQPFFTPELIEIFRNLEEQIPPGTTTAAVAELMGQLMEEVAVTGTDETPEEIAERYQAEFDALDEG
jgi:ABC-type glycerol-3-phosphate transport system substrate-binding protein